MENICHTLVGAALSKAGLEKKTALATPTLLIAANLPDLDIAGTALGKNYLDFHRGITHAVVGIATASVLLAAAVWAVDRILFRRRPQPARLFALWYVALAGLVTHPFLDFMNDYGIRPWMPFSAKWYYGDMLSIVDPWIWIILGAALFAATRTRAGRFAWAGLSALLAGLIFGTAGVRFGVVWLGVLAGTVAAALRVRRRGMGAPGVALAVFGVYLAATAVLHWHVLRSARTSAAQSINEPVTGVHVLPGRPDGHSRWIAVAESEARYYFADMGTFGFAHGPVAFQSFEKNLDDPCYRAALSQERMAVMTRFARFPSVSSHSSGGSCIVVLRDLRYARHSWNGWGTARATVPQKTENP